ncbi:hypothetical protein BDP27DRAFT_1365960 [Rhodocollybia butyracea]|uniref:Uncharacterized protein n=1 Tax=Rhodocollybia butyracea TaxID=206335 RepID=A0A9P5PMR6_9AGAR|nr:hypothetical protein BDP27DRAFT_1365960 [Rhodocollybia butyracea]
MYPTPAEAKKPVKNQTAAKTQILAPQPVTLDSEESYAHLVESLKNTSQVVVYVTKKVADLSNDQENNKKSKKKLKVPAERDIDPEDNPVNQNIIAIRGVLRDGPWQCWMVLNKQQLKSPPNNNLFTTNNEESTVASNVLQQSPPPVPLATPVTAATAMLLLLLLPPDRMPGLYMTMANFCTQDGLDNLVTQKLIELGYANTSSLEYTQVSDLKESGLLPGNIAQLCAAVSECLHEQCILLHLPV